ncbi:uncharacterized protein [Cherax quadricarinatus]|uniref:uncharacterized protein isoform X1 n=1 Tax=Cherax quadricarinatus TaxID=27406 RepID=UPI00387E8A69
MNSVTSVAIQQSVVQHSSKNKILQSSHRISWCNYGSDTHIQESENPEAGKVQETRMEPRILEWDGSKPLLPIPDTNYAVHFLEMIAKYGDAIAMVNAETQEQRSYSELCGLVPRVSAGLHAAGVTLDHAVLYLAPNHIDYPLVLLSVLYCGAAFAPASPYLRTEELIHMINVSGVRWAVIHNTVVDKAEAAFSLLPSGTIKRTWIFGDAAGCPNLLDLMHYEPLPPITKVEGLKPERAVALMFLSSGTTGLPKVIMLTHRNLLAGLTLVRCSLSLNDPGTLRKRFMATLLVLPFYHIHGHHHVVIPMAYGSTIVTLSKFSPETFLDSIQKFKVTLMPLVPYFIKFIVETPLLQHYDLSSLRVIITGGSTLQPSHAAALKQKINTEVFNVYGMTEATCPTTQFITTSSFKEGCVGKVQPYFQLKVVNVENGEMLGPGQEGEVCCQGPSIMLGYANNAAATAETLDTEGWLHTGDIGYFDHDNFVYLTDRIKELIKVKGFQVSPSELEKLLLTHTEVTEAAVVGVRDDKLGEAPKAFVVLRPGASIDSSQLQQFVASRVSSYKQLAGGIQVVDFLPRSHTGKVLKKLLKKRRVSPAAKL